MVAEYYQRAARRGGSAATARGPGGGVSPGASIGGKTQAFPLFAQGQTVEQVAAAIGRAHSTVRGYLSEFIEREQITDSEPWLDEATLEQVRRAAEAVGWERMKPIFDALQGAVPYEQIRIALACLRNSRWKRGERSGVTDV
jgi:ATP-dependent DNA helicase RecQ